MTTMSTGNVARAPYTVTSAITSRSIEVLTMPDVTSIVFVVDDDVSVRESLELLLRAAGLQPETFASAQEFLARPRPAVPCCLVLDVTLPGLSGLDLQKRLVERTDMPIIFITGHGDVPMSVQAMKAGAVEFLTKPTMRCWTPYGAPSSAVAQHSVSSPTCEPCATVMSR
jgi:CheY-like chemotaxis protein